MGWSEGVTPTRGRRESSREGRSRERRGVDGGDGYHCSPDEGTGNRGNPSVPTVLPRRGSTRNTGGVDRSRIILFSESFVVLPKG